MQRSTSTGASLGSYVKIERKRWKPFFDDFSKEHLGVPVSVEVTTPETGPHGLSESMPLVGITAAQEQGEGFSIEIILGDSPERNLTHTVRNPARVTLGPATEDAPFMLEIEAENNGEVVIIRRPGKPMPSTSEQPPLPRKPR